MEIILYCLDIPSLIVWVLKRGDPLLVMVKETLIMKKHQRDTTWQRCDLLVMIWLWWWKKGAKNQGILWAITLTYNQQEHEDLGPTTQDTELCQQPEWAGNRFSWRAIKRSMASDTCILGKWDLPSRLLTYWSIR